MSSLLNIENLSAKVGGKEVLKGVSLTLRADWAAIKQLEIRTGESYAAVFDRMLNGIPRMTDLLETAAALALPRGKHNADALMAIMPFDGGECLRDLRNHIVKAIEEGMPKRSEKAEDGGEAGKPDPDPQ